MRVAVLLLVGCFSPRTPSGVICDPNSPACPEGQVCRLVSGDYVCASPGVDEDAGVDGETPDAAPFAHVRLADGWSVAVYQDFSAAFTYVASDWMEATEVYDNQPSYMFTLRGAFGDALAVIAGRRIFVLPGSSAPVVHDFGMHMPNTNGVPDHLTGGVYVPPGMLANASLLVSSSSEDTGDGIYRIATDWSISLDTAANNTRSVLFDPMGAFDARGMAETYLGTQNGIVRRADNMVIAAGDTKAMRLVGSTLYIARQIGTVQRLLRISSDMNHSEVPLGDFTRARIGEGQAPDPYSVWAVIDDARFVMVAADGSQKLVAEVTDSSYKWHAVVVPLAGPLVGRAYVLESNRTRDIDRVLALRMQ